MAYNQFPERPDESVGSWMLTLLLCGIPVIGFIYLLVLAFGSGAAPSKRNFARSSQDSTAVTDVSSHVFQRGRHPNHSGAAPPFLASQGLCRSSTRPITTPWEIGHIPWCDLRLSAGRSIR